MPRIKGDIVRLPFEQGVILGKRKQFLGTNQISKYTADHEGTLTKPSTERGDNFLLRLGSKKKSKDILKILNFSTKECPICISTNKNSLSKMIRKNLDKKYLTTRESYGAKVVNDIVYNENTHIVSVFKDYLIYDDLSEYLKRFYLGSETATRLPKIYDFYEKYSKVFPNYVALPQNKLMFKNIERKQRVIDECHGDAKKKEELANDSNSVGNKLFTTVFLKELNRPGETFKCLDSSNEKSMSQLQSFLKHKVAGTKDRKEPAINELSLRGLVEKYISKDSQSLIDVTDAIKRFDTKGEDFKQETRRAIYVRSSSDVMLKTDSRASPHPLKNNIAQVKSPIMGAGSRNSVPGGSVWPSLKEKMLSQKTSSELRVKTISSGKIPLIVTKNGIRPESRTTPQRPQKAGNNIKTPKIFVWSDNSPNTNPLNLQGMRISPSRVREIADARHEVRSRMPNNIPSIFTTASSSKDANKKRTVLAVEGFRGIKASSNRFKSEYLTKLENKNQKLHLIKGNPRVLVDQVDNIYKKRNSEKLGGLAYSKSVGMLDNYRGNTNTVVSPMRNTNTRQGPRNSEIYGNRRTIVKGTHKKL